MTCPWTRNRRGAKLAARKEDAFMSGSKALVFAATVATAFALVAGCASRAASVRPMRIPVSNYASLSCAEAKEQLQLTRQREAELTRAQDIAGADDALTTAMSGLPLRSLTGGDRSRALARARGEAIALEQAVRQKCPQA